MSVETHRASSLEVRLAARRGQHTTHTAGIAPGHLQANLIVLPSRYAADFRQLCGRNTVPCPLIAESAITGCYDEVVSCIPGLSGDELLRKGCDLRRDIPRFMVYEDSQLTKSHCEDVVDEWTQDCVAFLIGCSYSFEAEHAAAGLSPRHSVLGKMVPMYRTRVPLCPSGVFTGGTYVMSMRPYRRRDVERVRDITRRYGVTHGEPIDWGWDAMERLGIKDLQQPDWGDAPVGQYGGRLVRGDEGDEDADVPVFWGCGVTPQEAVMKAGLQGTVIAHAPGHMLVLDARDEDIKS
ncbi:FKBP12-associated protein 1-like protein [Purpureocillium lavendulum]|uniref:FKBP12-associated protein 1-like protein n=1 Tax=Purpureocillium lavendulum TaxID=1247861 RepID=A0AB34G5Z4_9HYPO|nr:FKBP12-associated protein 1-like protein [Purpureocillium lavendulum]